MQHEASLSGAFTALYFPFCRLLIMKPVIKEALIILELLTHTLTHMWAEKVSLFKCRFKPQDQPQLLQTVRRRIQVSKSSKFFALMLWTWTCVKGVLVCCYSFVPAAHETNMYWVSAWSPDRNMVEKHERVISLSHWWKHQLVWTVQSDGSSEVCQCAVGVKLS